MDDGFAAAVSPAAATMQHAEEAAAVGPATAHEPRVCADTGEAPGLQHHYSAKAHGSTRRYWCVLLLGAVCQGVAKNPLANQVLVPEPKADEPESGKIAALSGADWSLGALHRASYMLLCSVDGIGGDPTAASLTGVEQESLSNRGEDSPEELKSLNSIDGETTTPCLSNEE